MSLILEMLCLFVNSSKQGIQELILYGDLFKNKINTVTHTYIFKLWENWFSHVGGVVGYHRVHTSR